MTHKAEQPSINLAHRCHPTQRVPTAGRESPPGLDPLWNEEVWASAKLWAWIYIFMLWSAFSASRIPNVIPAISSRCGSRTESAVRSWRTLGLGDIVKDDSRWGRRLLGYYCIFFCVFQMCSFLYFVQFICFFWLFCWGFLLYSISKTSLFFGGILFCFIFSHFAAFVCIDSTYFDSVYKKMFYIPIFSS